jgi:formate dehydrogenase major subunit
MELHEFEVADHRPRAEGLRDRRTARLPRVGGDAEQTADATRGEHRLAGADSHIPPRPTDERTGARYPLILTTGRILSQYNVGAQTRRTSNTVWHDEDVLEIHPFDAENRGVREGDLVAVQSRSGEISLRAHVTERMQPGVVYTTFHHARTGANVITTDYSDWATNCPEYKVTAVQVRRTNHLSAWQDRHDAEEKILTRIGDGPVPEAAE